MAKPLLNWSVPAIALRSQGRGITQELKRGLLGGVPHPSSRTGADVSVSLDGSVARPISGWLKVAGEETWARLCVHLVCVLFWLLLFPREVPCQSSKSCSADPRERETCLRSQELGSFGPLGRPSPSRPPRCATGTEEPRCQLSGLPQSTGGRAGPRGALRRWAGTEGGVGGRRGCQGRGGRVGTEAQREGG